MSKKPEKRDHWFAIAPVWNLIVGALQDENAYLTGFNSVRRELALLCAVHLCEAEVCNGGFRQFFWNEAGMLAPESVEGFRAIGMAKTAGTVERAMSVLGSRYPRDRGVRAVAVEALAEDAFKSLEEEFYALRATENGGYREAAYLYAVRSAAAAL